MPLVIGLSKPGLIHGQDPLAVQQQAQQLQGELLPHILVSQGVGMQGHLLGLPELQQLPFLQHLIDCAVRDVQALVGFDVVLDLLSRSDRVVLVHEVGRSFSYRSTLVQFGDLLVMQLSQVVRVLLHLLQERLYLLPRYLVSSTDVLVVVLLNDDIIENVELLQQGQFRELLLLVATNRVMVLIQVSVHLLVPVPIVPMYIGVQFRLQPLLVVSVRLIVELVYFNNILRSLD